METKPITKQDDNSDPLRFPNLKSGFLIRIEGYNNILPEMYHPEKIRDMIATALEADSTAPIQEGIDFDLEVSRTYEYEGETKTKKAFVAMQNRVHDSLRRLVCRARSQNMAIRIANALNKHVSDKRGQ